MWTSLESALRRESPFQGGWTALPNVPRSAEVDLAFWLFVRLCIYRGDYQHTTIFAAYSVGPYQAYTLTHAFPQLKSTRLRFAKLRPSFLLYAGAKVGPGHEDSLQSYAAGSGHVEIVALLISAGADVNFVEEDDGDTPLMGAVSSEEHIPDENVCAMVRNLLYAGADAQATSVYDNNVVTVLEAAMSRGSIELIQLLLDGGARVTESTFLKAVEYSNLDIVRLLLTSGAPITCSVIEGAAENGKSGLVMSLLDSAEDSIKETSSSAAMIKAILTH